MSRIISRKIGPSPARQRLYRAVAVACAVAGAWQVFDASRPAPRPQAASPAQATPAPASSMMARAPDLAPPPAASPPAPVAALAAAAPAPAPVVQAPVDVQQLTASRPLAAQAFLREVSLSPRAHGGFVVDDLLADGRYDRMGLRRGDVLYTLDTPAMAQVDESSMIALTQQTEIELDIYRDGVPMRLHVALNVDPTDATERDEPR